MGLGESAKEIWKSITRRPVGPEEQRVRTNVPMEPFGTFTTQIPQGPTQDTKSTNTRRWITDKTYQG